MREIKFRAKAIEDFETHIEGIEKGDWVYGYYYFDRADMCGIIVTELQEESGGVGSGIMQCHIKVDYKTVGQFTGLLDKNGKEIYEGDIVQTWYSDKVKGGIAVIKYLGRSFCMSQNKDDDEMDCPWFFIFEVIGNIYENPDLIND